MRILTSYLTENPCYKAGRIINVRGLMLHSVGVPQPDPTVFVRNWNSPDYDRACVHGFIGEDEAYITLPCLETAGTAMRGWHAGDVANNTHIGVEMCEPDSIRYTGGASFTATDRAAAVAYVTKTTANAAELFARLCSLHGLDPLRDIISHAEGAALGIASNHADPDHLWRQLGMNYDMDSFRRDVAARMAGSAEPQPEPGDWSREAREWAVKKGIFVGSGGASPDYRWGDAITREEAAAVLYRFALDIGAV